MTDEAKAIAGRLRQVSSVLFDDYGDGTYAVEDYALAGKASDLIETQARENERLKEEMQRIADSCPKCEGRGAYKHRRRMVDCEFCETARAALAGDSHDQ